MRVAAALPRHPGTPELGLRPQRVHAVEVGKDGRTATATLCALLVSGLDLGGAGLRDWRDVRRGRCPTCSAMVEHRRVQGDVVEDLASLASSPA